MSWSEGDYGRGYDRARAGKKLSSMASSQERSGYYDYLNEHKARPKPSPAELEEERIRKDKINERQLQHDAWLLKLATDSEFKKEEDRIHYLVINRKYPSESDTAYVKAEFKLRNDIYIQTQKGLGPYAQT